MFSLVILGKVPFFPSNNQGTTTLQSPNHNKRVAAAVGIWNIWNKLCILTARGLAHGLARKGLCS